MFWAKLVLIPLLGAAACGASAPQTPSASPEPARTLSGLINAVGDCIEAGKGYRIVVRDEDGSIIGSTVAEEFDSARVRANECDAIAFRVGVPLTDFYVVGIEGVSGELTWTRDELETEFGWFVHINTT